MKTFGKNNSGGLAINLLGRYFHLPVFFMAVILVGCGGGGGGGLSGGVMFY